MEHASIHPDRWRPWMLTWVVVRQHRGALICLGVVAIAAIGAMAGTGEETWSAYRAVVAHPSNLNLRSAFALRTNSLTVLVIALHLAPIVCGTFLGAPLLAREIESETFRFAWTQGTARERVVAANLLILGVAGVVFAALIGSVGIWWMHPFDALNIASRWQPGQFDTAPLVLAGWSLVSFALGALSGGGLRRAISAMAVTAAVSSGLFVLAFWIVDAKLIALFSLVQRAVPGRLAQQGSINSAASVSASVPRGSWIIRGWYTDRVGHVLNSSMARQISDLIVLAKSTPGRTTAVLRQHGISYWLSFQPPDRFWAFQGAEFLALVAIALGLGFATIRQTRRSF